MLQGILLFHENQSGNAPDNDLEQDINKAPVNEVLCRISWQQLRGYLMAQKRTKISEA